MATQTTPNPSAGTREHADAGPFGEDFIGLGRQAGLGFLDAYEKGLYTWADYADRFAGASPNRWVAEAVRAQADLTREATRVSTGVARDLLK